ncbi:MAG: hypothetical protein ACYC1U_04610 [Candidatus Aquicultorales bacterium]
MYAINHAATALIIKRKYPDAPIAWILISTQVVELLWVVLNMAGVEKVRVEDDVIHLDSLPFSHSVLTGAGLGLLAWLAVGKGLKKRALGSAVGLGIASHVFLDLLTHEPDIELVPLAAKKKMGLNLYNHPLLTTVAETSYGILCWRIFHGNRALLEAIVLLNLANIPIIFGNRIPSIGKAVKKWPLMLPSVILGQIIMTWLVVGFLSQSKSSEPPT